MNFQPFTINSIKGMKASNLQRKELTKLGVSFKLSKKLTIIEADKLIKKLKDITLC